MYMYVRLTNLGLAVDVVLPPAERCQHHREWDRPAGVQVSLFVLDDGPHDEAGGLR